MRKAVYFMLILTMCALVFAWKVDAAEEQLAPAPQIKAEVSAEPEMQWLWGEVVSVDAANKRFLVKYLDYETDSEKELGLIVSEETTYENVKAIDEIKPLDAVSIDYIVNQDGSATAKNISVEKIESLEIPQQENNNEDLKAPPSIKQ